MNENDENPEIFIESQWQRQPGPNLYYLLYRWSVTVFFVVTWISFVVDALHMYESAANRAKWLIYLTNWGYTICMLQTLFAAVMLSSCFLHTWNRDARPIVEVNALKLYRIYWITNITATDLAFGITVVYWLFIYDENKTTVDVTNIIYHVVNSVLMLLDLLVVAHPVKMLHVYCPVSLAVCYIIFSIIYHLAGGTTEDDLPYIYDILDWSKPVPTAMLCATLTIFLISLHCFSYAIYCLRIFIYEKLNRT